MTWRIILIEKWCRQSPRKKAISFRGARTLPAGDTQQHEMLKTTSSDERSSSLVLVAPVSANF